MKEEIDSNSKCRTYATIFGAFLILLPSDPPSFWGNMSIYVLSYLSKHNIDNGTSILNTPWVLSIFVVSLILGIMAGGPLNSWTTPKTGIAIGILCQSIGIVASYFTVSLSATALIVSFGCLYGFGVGVAQGLVYKFVLSLFSGDSTGFLISIVLSGSSLGSMIINEVVTMFINPRNTSPNYRTSEQLEFFHQEEIVDRVPTMFLIVGAISVATQVVGFCLLRQKPPGKASGTVENGSSGFGQAESREGIVSSNGETSTISNENVVDNQQAGFNVDIKPNQLFHYGLFYALWILIAAGEASYLFIGNYYKAYGQIWINDDHFLTTIGTTLCVVSTIVRICWAFVMDRIGIKNSFVGIFTLLPLFFLFLYFAPMVNKWLYLTVNIMIGCVHFCAHPTFIASVVKYFGKKHLSENLGICFTGVLAMNLISPPLYKFLLVTWGWFSLIVWTAGAFIVPLVLSVLVVP